MVGYVYCALFVHWTAIRIADLTKTYRGACTVKDWSNITACPVQWCNDGKGSFPGYFESLMDFL